MMVGQHQTIVRSIAEAMQKLWKEATICGPVMCAETTEFVPIDNLAVARMVAAKTLHCRLPQICQMQAFGMFQAYFVLI